MVQGLGFARFGRPNRVSRRRLRRLARIRYCSPKGPCTPILCGLAPKCQHGDYFKAKVPRNLLSCILVRGVVPYADFSDVSMPIRHESCIPFLLPGACLLSLMGRKTPCYAEGLQGSFGRFWPHAGLMGFGCLRLGKFRALGVPVRT